MRGRYKTEKRMYGTGDKNFLQKIVLFLLFLGSMNFMAKYFYLMFFALVFCVLMNRGKIRSSYIVILLLVLSGSFMLFSPSAHADVTTFLKPLVYPICFVIGYNLIYTEEYVTEEFLLVARIIIIVAAGAVVHLGINAIYNRDASLRNTIDIWSKEVLSATGQAALSCLGIGCACAALTSKIQWKYKIISMIALIVMLGYNLILATRTMVFMTILIEAAAIVHLMITKQEKGTKIKFAIGAAGILLIMGIVYFSNLWNIRTMIETSNLFVRIIGGEQAIGMSDSRLQIKLNYLTHMWEYPFGGANLRAQFSYAHDLLLDGWDEAGMVAFLMLVGMLVYSVKIVIWAVVSKDIPFVVRQIILCVYMAFYIEFLMEPILLGMQWLFGTFCVINGVLGRLRYKARWKYDGVTEQGT